MIDLGQYDAVKTEPSSEEEFEKACANFKARLKAYLEENDNE